VYGLYTSVLPVLLYAVFGTSKQLNIGTFSLVSLLIENGQQAILASYAEIDIHELERVKIAIVMLMSFITGIFLIFLSFLRTSHYVSMLLPDALISGMTTAASIQIATSQLKPLFDMNLKLPSGPASVFVSWWLVIEGVFGKQNVNWLSFALGIATIVSILMLQSLNRYLKQNWRSFKFPVPDVLLPVVITSILTFSFGWYKPESFGITIVGDIPSGFPAPINPFSPSSLCFSGTTCDITKIVSVTILPSITVGLVAFVISAAIIKLYAKKHNDNSICLDQDMMALGLASLLGSCIGNSIVPSGSLSRTALVDGVGGQTQVVGIMAGLCVGLVVWFAAPLLQYIPYSVLAAIVIVAILKITSQLREGIQLLRISFGYGDSVLGDNETMRARRQIKQVEALIWWITFVVVLVVGLDIGLAVGMLLCLVILLRDNGIPRLVELGIGQVQLLKPMRSLTSVAHHSTDEPEFSNEDVAVMISADSQGLVIDDDGEEIHPLTLQFYTPLKVSGWLSRNSVDQWGDIPRQCRPPHIKMPSETPVKVEVGVERCSSASLYQFYAPQILCRTRFLRYYVLWLCDRLAPTSSNQRPLLLILDISCFRVRNEPLFIDRLQDLCATVADKNIRLIYVIPLSLEIETNVDISQLIFPTIAEAIAAYQEV
jgi:MFS superfamily sulfate permease-like transporter